MEQDSLWYNSRRECRLVEAQKLAGGRDDTYYLPLSPSFPLSFYPV